MKFKIKNSFEDKSGEYWYEADGSGYRAYCYCDEKYGLMRSGFSKILDTEKEAREWLQNQWDYNNGIEEIIDDFCTKLASEQKNIPPEFEKTFRENYSKLLAEF